MVDLKKRILEIAYKHKLSHLGSYLSAVNIIDEIYHSKNLIDINEKTCAFYYSIKEHKE